MSVIGNDQFLFPGMGATRDSQETQIQWNAGRFTMFGSPDIIDATATDAGNTPTNVLRAGLAMGKKTTGTLVAYNAANTDGSGVLYGFMPFAFDTFDMFTQLGVQRYMSVVIGGCVQASQCIGLDGQGRADCRGRFVFDDDVAGRGGFFPFRGQVSKTVAYQVLATDSGTMFDNTGAVASVTFTLPAIANGLTYSFLGVANQNVLVSSTEGTNMVTFNNASASTIALQTPGQIIGGIIKVYSNPGATKWIVETPTKNAITIS